MRLKNVTAQIFVVAGNPPLATTSYIREAAATFSSARRQEMKTRHPSVVLFPTVLLVVAGIAGSATKHTRQTAFLGNADDNSHQLIHQGRQIFRFDTFGDEAFWGDQLHLHDPINTLTPRNALALGLK